MNYTTANQIAEKCSKLNNLICNSRYEYRDCDRPLCCGFCPQVDNCESMCSKLKGESYEDNRENLGQGILD